MEKLNLQEHCFLQEMYYYGEKLADGIRPSNSISARKAIIDHDEPMMISIFNLELVPIPDSNTPTTGVAFQGIKTCCMRDGEPTSVSRTIYIGIGSQLRHMNGNGRAILDDSHEFRLEKLYENFALMWYVRFCAYEAIMNR